MAVSEAHVFPGFLTQVLTQPDFADNKINVTQKLNITLSRVENIMEKGENAGNQHFLLFPACFQKISFSASLKVRIGWYRVDINLYFLTK